jgi:hypothetical protein
MKNINISSNAIKLGFSPPACRVSTMKRDCQFLFVDACKRLPRGFTRFAERKFGFTNNTGEHAS